MKHVVILRQPFFNMVLSGEKTIESRWSINRCAPWGKVKVGDVLLLKETGKDVTATAIADRVEFICLTPQQVEEIRIKYGKAIGTNKFKNWETTLNKKFCTLIWLREVKKVNPIKVPRSCGAGWIVVK